MATDPPGGAAAFRQEARRLSAENSLLREQLEAAEAEAKASARDAERFRMDADRARREMYKLAERHGEK